MSLEARFVALVNAIGGDIKQLNLQQGSLDALTTTAKGSLVAALNELKAAVDGAGGGAVINDGASGTETTWSSSKIAGQITAAIDALVAASPGTLDTLAELADALGNDPNFATTIASQVAARIRFDAAQTLTVLQQAQACANLGIGNPERDFVSDYTAAKA